MNARATPTEAEAFEASSASQLRIPPHSSESETALLGGLLMDNGLWDVVGDMVAEADFYAHQHRVIFTAIASLVMANKPADVITTYARLQAAGKAEDAGGLGYLNALAQYTPTARTMRSHAQTIRERSLSRRLISAADEIATQAFSSQAPIEERIEQATGQLAALLQEAPRDDWQEIGPGMVELVEHMQAQADGQHPDFTPTGIAAIDERLDGGMRGGELIVIGARPSMGKSALALTISANVACEAKPVGIFSMEMPRRQVYGRLLSMKSKVHLTRIKRPERLGEAGWSDLNRAIEKLVKQYIAVNDQSGLTITQVRTKTRALLRRFGKLGLIVVDYLGLMNGTDPKIPRAYQLEEVTKGLKAMAKELGIPVILLVQLNRKVEERVDQMPMLSDIRDAGSVEQDADVILFLHRPHKSNPDLGDEWKFYAKGSAAKVRDGEPGNFDLQYLGANTHFSDWPASIPLPVVTKTKTNGKSL